MESDVCRKFHPCGGMDEFEALLKGFSRVHECEVLEFLEDLTVRPADPSLSGADHGLSCREVGGGA